jgi:hypothetical protein
MPNWFYLTIEVNGSKEDIKEFVDNVQGSEKHKTEELDFDFNHFIPQPDDIFRGALGQKERKHCKENNIPNWYDWNTRNWGTKWNANCDHRDIYYSVDSGFSGVMYRLSTAWADPRPVLNKMIEMYPNLIFTISGEEESAEYGIYMSTEDDLFFEEQPKMIDNNNGKEVYFDSKKSLYRYTDNKEAVHDQDDFYPTATYSWS